MPLLFHQKFYYLMFHFTHIADDMLTHLNYIFAFQVQRSWQNLKKAPLKIPNTVLWNKYYEYWMFGRVYIANDAE